MIIVMGKGSEQASEVNACLFTLILSPVCGTQRTRQQAAEKRVGERDRERDREREGAAVVDLIEFVHAL